MDSIFLQIGSMIRKPKHKAQNRLLGQSTFDVKQSMTRVSVALRKIRIIDDAGKYLISSLEVILYRLVSSSVNENSDKNLSLPKEIKASNRKPMKNQARNTQKTSKRTILFKNQQTLKSNINFDMIKAISKWRINLLPLISCFKKPILLSLLISCGTSLAHITEKNRSLI